MQHGFARIYAGSVTVDLIDLVIEARAIFGHRLTEQTLRLARLYQLMIEQVATGTVTLKSKLYFKGTKLRNSGSL